MWKKKAKERALKKPRWESDFTATLLPGKRDLFNQRELEKLNVEYDRLVESWTCVTVWSSGK